MIKDELNSLKPRINSWTLANDSALRSSLEKFTNGLTQKLEEQEKLLKETYHEYTRAQIRVENVNNKISYLKNFKFIEHRIKEDDEPIATHKPIYKQKSKQERQDEMIDSIRQAVSKGFSMVDNNFKKIEIKASDFDDDLDNSYIPDPIFEPLNPYLRRSLPHIIGSEQFYQSISTGLDESFDQPEKKVADEEVVIGLPQPVIPKRTSPQVTASSSSASFRQEERLSITPSLPSRESSPRLEREEIPTTIKDSTSKQTPILPGGHQQQLFEELFRKTRPIPAATSSNHSPKSQRSALDAISDGTPSLQKDFDRASLSSKMSRQSGIMPKTSIFDESDDEDEKDLFVQVAKKMQEKPVQKTPTPVKSTNVEPPKASSKPLPKPRIEVPKVVAKVDQDGQKVATTSPKGLDKPKPVEDHEKVEEKIVAKTPEPVKTIPEPIPTSIPKTHTEPSKTAANNRIEAKQPIKPVEPQPVKVVPIVSSSSTPQPSKLVTQVPAQISSNMGLSSSKKKSIFDDSDSDNDLFGSSKSSQKSSTSSKISSQKQSVSSTKENSPVKQSIKQVSIEKPKIQPKSSPTIKKKSLFDSDSSEDELFKTVSLTKSSLSTSQKNSRPTPTEIKSTDKKEVVNSKIDTKANPLVAAPIADEKISISETSSNIEGRISPSQRPASIASTSSLEPISSQQNDEEPKKSKIQVSDNLERGPSSVAARIAQIGMKIPVGPPGSRRPMSMVGDILSNHEKAQENESKQEEPAQKLPAIVKSRPKGPARRAPTSHRHTLAPSSETNESTSAGESSDTTLSPITKVPDLTPLKQQEADSTPKKSPITPETPSKTAVNVPASSLPPRPPSATDNAAKLAQEALEKRKVSPKTSLEPAVEKAKVSPKTSLSPKSSPRASPILVRASASISSTGTSKTETLEKSKKSIFESSSDEEVVRPRSKAASITESVKAKTGTPASSLSKEDTDASKKTTTTTTTPAAKKTTKGLFDDSDSDLDIFKKN